MADSCRWIPQRSLPNARGPTQNSVRQGSAWSPSVSPAEPDWSMSRRGCGDEQIEAVVLAGAPKPCSSPPPQVSGSWGALMLSWCRAERSGTKAAWGEQLGCFVSCPGLCLCLLVTGHCWDRQKHMARATVLGPLGGKVGRLHLGVHERVQYVLYLFSAKSTPKEWGQG